MLPEIPKYCGETPVKSTKTLEFQLENKTEALQEIQGNLSRFFIIHLYFFVHKFPFSDSVKYVS